jgi:heme/copper-type cytochrome/quinol oxidase subunit 3
VSELAHHAAGDHHEIVGEEPPELLGRNLSSAGHLLASATAFFFLAFVFAYFYLRSLNNAHLWKPKGVSASITFGTVVMALTVACALLVWLGLSDHRAGRRAQWRTKGALALACGVAAVVVQVVEWTSNGFGPADGGYASVFIGWTGFNLLFLVGALFWLETVLAVSVRYRGVPAVPPGHASGDPGRMVHDIADPVSLVRAELVALSFYWSFLAALGVLAWVILYLA